MKQWHFHIWSVWSNPFNSMETRTTDSFGKTADVSVVRQFRRCSVCNELQTRIMCDGTVEEIKVRNINAIQ